MSNLFNERFMQYASQNFNFGLYYDKIYKKEYLPSRIRYNQFFFYAALSASCYYLLFQHMFFKSGQNEKDLGQRKYYTSDRSIVNLLMRQMNRGAVASQVSKQEYIL